MTRLSELPRVSLTQTDKSALIDVATAYEQAQGVYEDAKENEKVAVAYSFKLAGRASRMRAKATDQLIRWANRRLTEPVVGVGYPRGSNFPRLKKAYDASYDHRKWGSAGCAREAARYLRKIIKRGWV